MAIYPKCDRCGVELKEFGAILLSPPINNMVEKRHLCVACYQTILLPSTLIELERELDEAKYEAEIQRQGRHSAEEQAKTAERERDEADKELHKLRADAHREDKEQAIIHKMVMEFSVTVLVCDRPTANGRIYPENIVRKAVAEYMKQPVRLGPINDGIIKLNTASFEVVQVTVEYDKLHVECRTLPTAYGQALARELDTKVPAKRALRIVPVWLGTVNKEGVVSDCELLGFSFGAPEPVCAAL